MRFVVIVPFYLCALYIALYALYIALCVFAPAYATGLFGKWVIETTGENWELVKQIAFGVSFCGGVIVLTLICCTRFMLPAQERKEQFQNRPKGLTDEQYLCMSLEEKKRYMEEQAREMAASK